MTKVKMKMAEIISHIYQDNVGRWIIQSNEEHSVGVARLAARFAGEFGMSEWGKVLGLLHDKGKESQAFQQHIRKDSGYEPDIKVCGNYNHAFIGGVLARKLYGKSADIFFVNQIVSHHTGLHDYDEIEGILNQNIPAEVNINIGKEKLNVPAFKIQTNDFHHLARMMFSCLVDADFLDTEAFMDKESSMLRRNKATLYDLLPLLENKLKDLKAKADNSNVNAIRNQVQQQCIKMADTEIGFYSLTVPTGGGKTLSSLVWAMKHAIRNGQKRIIIAIPYTSIIVQTASVLRSIFGEENVLEHHSNVDPEHIKDERLQEKMKLATENWDYPIIVTTNVQLFESMFSNKPSVCRKLHNIVNSVVILDEVQTLPMDYLQPVVDSLKTYHKLFNVSFLSKEHNLPKGEMQAANYARLSLGTGIDWFAPDVMTSYFKQLYCRKECFDVKNMKHYLYNPKEICFATAAKEFQMIEDNGINVVVCWRNSFELIQQLLEKGPSYILIKKLSKYIVNITKTDFKTLLDMGVISEKKEGLFVVDYKQQYDEHIGLCIDNNWANEVLIQ